MILFDPVEALGTFLATAPSGAPAGTEELLVAVPPSTSFPKWARRPSLCHDGSRVVVSVKLARGGADAARVLVEPGSPELTVPEQIVFARLSLSRLLAVRGWQAAAHQADAALASVLPTDLAETRDWWGGIWLALAAKDVRAYVNLRWGDRAARWARVAGAFGALSGGEPTLPSWAGPDVREHTTPVGLGLEIGGGAVRAVRVYSVVERGRSGLGIACGALHADAARALTQHVEHFATTFGDPPSRGLTLAYDELLGVTRSVSPGALRLKVELCCQTVPIELHPTIIEWAARVATDAGFEASHLSEFLLAVKGNWGDWHAEFVSLGFGVDLEHITVYVKPVVRIASEV